MSEWTLHTPGTRKVPGMVATFVSVLEETNAGDYYRVVAVVEYDKTHKLALVEVVAWVDSYMGVWNVEVRPANVELPDSLAYLQQRFVPVKEQNFTTDWLV